MSDALSDDPRFERALAFLRACEGGESDRADDDGGHTKWGVTQRTYDAWRRRHGLAARSVFEIEGAEARSLYRSEYWIFGRCYLLPAPVDLAHFDACVNPGPGAAAELLQACVHVATDGEIGPQTLRAVGREDPRALAERIIFARAGYYVNEVRNDAKDRVFLAGWLNRCHLLIEAVRMDAA